MAGPVNGLGAGQQVPLSNTFKPGENSARTQESRKPQEETSQTGSLQGAQESQPAETSRADTLRAQQASASNQNDGEFDLADKKRGSLVDITV